VVPLDIAMRDRASPDLEMAAIADRQGGVLGRGQLLALGVSAPAIGRRVATGRLHIIYRGVYALGYRRIGVLGWRWAAVLACGEGAVLSHGSAADAWGIRRSASPRPHVIVPRRARIRQPGIVVHSPRHVLLDEVTRLDGLPITTPARTLLDLAAGGLRGRPLEAALDRAERELRVDWAEMHRMLERHAGRPGVPALRETLARYAPGSVETFSVLEEIVLELCDEYSLPRPQVNCVIEGKRRDFYWPDMRLVVEADSYAWHRSPSALDDDRERDVELTLAGLRTLRFTYEQCTNRREYVRRSILRARGVD
jgi:very-short-patch-repair endonuclease